MNSHRRLIQKFAWLLAVPMLVFVPAFVADATPAAGVSFMVIGRATVPEFDFKRKIKELDHWRLRMDAEQPIEVVTVLFTVQPGGHGGWHTHPGPALFTIRTGTLTMYEGDDPTCTPKVFPAGTGSVEAQTESHIHILRNETSGVAETLVTFLIPVGADLRIDLADPGNCRF